MTHSTLEEAVVLDTSPLSTTPESMSVKPKISDASSRIFYVTLYGEVHKRMPTIEYIINEEKRLWTWYTPKIKPYE